MLDDVVGWSVRRADHSDLGALALVGAATFLDAYAGVLDGADIMAHCQRVHTAASFSAALATGGMAWLAELGSAELTGAPVGYALVEQPALPGATEADLELKRLYVLSRFWRLRIGSTLLRRAAAAARGGGAARLLAGVYGRNERAIAFYRRQGFRMAGTRQFLVGATTHDDVVMALELDQGGGHGLDGGGRT